MTPPSAFSPCPRCGHDLEPTPGALACKACHGVWVSEAEIERRLRERCRTDPGPLIFADGPGPVLPCPVCWDPMAPRSLEGVTVDRCSKHGVWFDADELERTMRAAQARLPPRVLTADGPPRPRAGASAPVSRRPAAPAPPETRSSRDDDGAGSRGSAWDVLEVLAEIAHAVARSLD
jgi:Zn-finger nucleic acid-binding protein